jgi:membrane protease YdiL (CAAX protease family)
VAVLDTLTRMRRRALPTDWADLARTLVPVAILILAAVVRETRPIALAGLLAGTAIAVRRDAPVRWSWAASVPVAVSLTWGLLPSPDRTAIAADCASPTSPIAMWRLAEALLVLGVAAVLMLALRASRDSIWLRWPRRQVAWLSIAAFLVAGPLSLLLGAALARPFFGTFELDLLQPGAIVPALVFALSNGIMEEVAYRGVLMGWLARVTGLWPAVFAQAVVFGLAHAGPDFVGSPLPVVAAMMVGGLLAGVITVRTRSLFFVIAVHAGFDVALYYGLACRIG